MSDVIASVLLLTGAALALAAPAADLVALVKPQFELGPEAVGRGGLVRDPDAGARAVEGVSDFLQSLGWRVHQSTDSPIRGGDGNLERLLWASNRPADA